MNTALELVYFVDVRCTAPKVPHIWPIRVRHPPPYKALLTILHVEAFYRPSTVLLQNEEVIRISSPTHVSLRLAHREIGILQRLALPNCSFGHHATLSQCRLDGLHTPHLVFLKRGCRAIDSRYSKTNTLLI